MKIEELKQYLDTEKVDVHIFEIEENTSEIKRMSIKDFKALAEENGLLNKVPEDQAQTIPLDEVMNLFEVVEE